MAEEEKSISTRGLIEADYGPLRRFTGVLDSCPSEDRTYQPKEGETREPRTTKRVSLNFKDLEVIEAVEPYHFPISTIEISKSNRKKSIWGVFSEGTPEDRSVGFNNVADQQYSKDQLDPASANFVKPSDRMDLEDAIGMRFGMVLCDGQDGRPTPPELFDGRAGKDAPRPAWTVYSIEGIGVAGGQGVSAMDKAMSLLNGKTIAQFNKEALADPVIRGDAQLLQAISQPLTSPTSFASMMLKGGQFVRDAQGVFSKVAA